MKEVKVFKFTMKCLKILKVLISEKGIEACYEYLTNEYMAQGVRKPSAISLSKSAVHYLIRIGKLVPRV